MKKLSLLILIALFGLQVTRAQDVVEEFDVFDHLGVGVSIGTTGFDFELAAPITDFLQVRAGYSFFPKTSYKYKSDIDYTKYGNGTLCNMKFHPTSLAAKDGVKKLAGVMKSYFEQGGMELQLNIVSSDTLRDAQKHPENYKDLVVRVAGFSAYFVEVFKDSQDDLIRRTEMSL